MLSVSAIPIAGFKSCTLFRSEFRKTGKCACCKKRRKNRGRKRIAKRGRKAEQKQTANEKHDRSFSIIRQPGRIPCASASKTGNAPEKNRLQGCGNVHGRHEVQHGPSRKWPISVKQTALFPGCQTAQGIQQGPWPTRHPNSCPFPVQANTNGHNTSPGR